MAGMIGIYHVKPDETRLALARRRRARGAGRPAAVGRAWTSTCTGRRHDRRRDASPIQFAGLRAAGASTCSPATPCAGRNNSVRVHTVNADDGSWASPRIVGDDSFSHEFDTPGTVALLLRAAPVHARRGRRPQRAARGPDRARRARAAPYTLRGRSALPAGQRRRDRGRHRRGLPAGRQRPPCETDGSFTDRRGARRTTATYRAVVGGRVQPGRAAARARPQARRVGAGGAAAASASTRASRPPRTGRRSSCSCGCPSTSAGGRSRAPSSTTPRWRASR